MNWPLLFEPTHPMSDGRYTVIRSGISRQPVME
jgi:hypothetical protein